MIIITEPNVSILDCDTIKFPIMAEALPDMENIQVFVAEMIRKNKDSEWLLKDRDILEGFQDIFSITENGGITLESKNYNLLFTGKEANQLLAKIEKTIEPRIKELEGLNNFLKNLKR